MYEGKNKGVSPMKGVGGGVGDDMGRENRYRYSA
jgi:hypothetical protein